MKPESNRPITIEDLLRLKQAERPPAEFWATFDRELRAKQLAALVQKRPWWQRLPDAMALMSRHRIPLGAAAIVALTVVTVRNYQPTAPEVAPQLDVPPSASAVDAISPAALATVVVAAAEPVALPIAEVAEEPASPPVAVSTISIPEGPQVAQALPVEPVRETEQESPAARHIVANLAVVQSSDVVLARSLLEVASGFENRALPARLAVEPLQQMRPPDESRRSRLLTAMVSTASLEASMRTTARAASRIEEERLYDQIHRFGARGDRVQVKF